MSILEAVLLKPLQGPIRSLFEFRRPGQARAVTIGKILEGFHHPGILKLLGLDPVDDSEINGVSRGGSDCEGERNDERTHEDYYAHKSIRPRMHANERKSDSRLFAFIRGLQSYSVGPPGLRSGCGFGKGLRGSISSRMAVL